MSYCSHIAVALVALLLLHLAGPSSSATNSNSNNFQQQCPCDFPKHHDYVQYGPRINASSSRWTFCVNILKSTGSIGHYLNSESFNRAIAYLKDDSRHGNGISFHVIDDEVAGDSLGPTSQFVIDRCNALISIDVSIHDRINVQKLCPHTCKSVPYASLAPNDFENFMESELPLLCSLTKGMLWSRFSDSEKHNIRDKKEDYIAIIIEKLFFRLMMECFETYHWSDFYYNYQASKRHEHSGNSNSNSNSNSGGNNSLSTLTSTEGVSQAAVLQQRMRNKLELAGKLRDHQHGSGRKHIPVYSGGTHASHHAGDHASRPASSYILPQSFYYKNSHIIRIPRRKIDGLIIWIGSEANRALIESQFIILRDAEHFGSGAVVGWEANDRLYSCRPGSTDCAGPRKWYKHLPRPAMAYMSEGWRCAQRRPLRALAHTLTLFDPLYAVVLDDDTFFNFPLFKQTFSSIVYKNLTAEPVILGEFTGAEGPNGHLTKKGMYGGGSGYVLGKKALDALVSYEVKYHGFDKESYSKDSDEFNRKFYHDRNRVNYGDEFRSDSQIRHLSVLSEGLEQLSTCNDPSSSSSGSKNNRSSSYGVQDICVALRPRPRQYNEVPQIDELMQWNVELKDTQSPNGDAADLFVPIAVRLIDFCTTSMASENTCLHSDHSFSRCLVFGGFVRPHSVICHSSVPLTSAPSDITFGMCFMAIECQKDKHITCHRYKPVLLPMTDVNLRFDSKHSSILDDIKLDYTVKPKKPFPVYSSMFDGNKTDTYMR